MIKVIRKRPYKEADFFLVRSSEYQNKLIFGEKKPITIKVKQAKVNKTNTLSMGFGCLI